MSDVYLHDALDTISRLPEGVCTITRFAIQFMEIIAVHLSKWSNKLAYSWRSV